MVERRIVRDSARLEATASPSVNVLSIVRYGILDLTFEVREITWSTEDKGGPRLLRDFGFAVDPDEETDQRESLFDLGDDLTCLGELDEEIACGASVLRLFLEERPVRDMEEHMLRLGLNGGLTERFVDDFLLNYFPKSFVVTDACLTNAPFLWFHKHFWM